MCVQCTALPQTHAASRAPAADPFAIPSLDQAQGQRLQLAPLQDTQSPRRESIPENAGRVFSPQRHGGLLQHSRAGRGRHGHITPRHAPGEERLPPGFHCQSHGGGHYYRVSSLGQGGVHQDPVDALLHRQTRIRSHPDAGINDHRYRQAPLDRPNTVWVSSPSPLPICEASGIHRRAPRILQRNAVVEGVVGVCET